MQRTDLELRLMDHLAKGETAEAATLAIECYGPSVLGYLRSTLDEDDAQDAFSTFAESLWRALATFRWECTVRVFAFRLAYYAVAHLARDPYRRRAQRLATTAASRLAASVVATTHRPGNSRTDRLRQLRASLDPGDRTLLALRIDRALEWDDIAVVLSTDGSPVNAAALRKRYERLKAKLARLAREQGLID